MGTDFVLQVTCTIFWLKRGLRVHLGLYAPDCPKSTAKYFIFTKVIRMYRSRCFTAMYHFWMQCLLQDLFRTAQSFKLFQTHILNVFLPKFPFFWPKLVLHDFGGFITKNASKIGCFGLNSTMI